jgi:acyl dehydratase
MTARSLPPVTFRITHDDLREYAEAAGDHNPIHLDPHAAAAAGLPGTIAHGMLVMGLATSAVESWAGAPATVEECGARWTRPVVVPATGTDVHVEATVVERLAQNRVRLRVTARCGDDTVMTMPRVVVALPRHALG